MNVAITAQRTVTPGYARYGAIAANTFSSTCPIVLNYLNDLAANGGIPLTTTNISFGLYISKPPSTSLSLPNINIGLSGASHPMPACRIYYSQIVVEPSKSIRYIEENRNKK